MSASTATSVSALSNTFSIGPVKMQVFDVPMISGDTTVVVTADRMSKIYFGILSSGVTQTAVPSISNNAITFTITDPAATIKGQAIVFGV